MPGAIGEVSRESFLSEQKVGELDRLWKRAENKDVTVSRNGA